MGLADQLEFCLQSILRHRFRSVMILVAIAFGVSAVLVLTALGEGARRYVLDEFSFLGKDILVMFPGRNETTGGLPPVTGAAARDITLEDIELLQRRLSSIRDVAPIVVGSAEVSVQQRSREVVVLGTSDAFVPIRQLTLARGRNIRTDDLQRAGQDCLVGQTVVKELIGEDRTALGALLRVADYRCRVVGVIQGRGDAFGMDLADSVLVSVAFAQRLFDVQGLFRVILQLQPGVSSDSAHDQILEAMSEFHQGEVDVTVISPDALLTTFGELLTVLTLGVGAIGSISLVVSGVLIMNVTLISVSQRTHEIGLLKALGASSEQVRRLFVMESVMMTAVGTAAGLVLAEVIKLTAAALLPQVDWVTPLWAWLAAPLVALLCSVGFSWLPASRAGRMAPVEALQKR